VEELVSITGRIEVAIVLPVSNMERSLEFYCDTLGCEVVRDEEDAGQGRRAVTLRFGNAVIDLRIDPEMPLRRDGSRLFWSVDKFDEALAAVELAGGRVVRRMEYGVYCADPDGNAFLVRPLEPDPEEMGY
jgi:catechol 2,3-dioxygenase-like lactoylglutathione lyase family enzyme